MAIAQTASKSLIASDKLPLQLARRIEGDIIRDGWRVGDVLGSEQELIEHYGVGRAVFRQAVRIVEHHQVAAMRRGQRGGLVITAPNPSVIVDAMAAYLEYAGVTIEQILAAKLIVEPFAAASAARCITEEGVSQLRAEIERPLTVEDLTKSLCNPLHSLIAELSGNAAVSVFVEVLNRLLVTYWHPATSPSIAAEAVEPAEQVHRALGHAVITGDAERAATIIGRHIRAISDWNLREVGRDYPARPGESGTDEERRVAKTSGRKLSRSLALQIQREIADIGWPVGMHLGYEPELIARYGVSRAVFREASRLLEHLGVVAVRMGPTGGLIVTAPEPSSATEATALLLEFERISASDVHSLRLVLELGCIDLLMDGGSTEEDLEDLQLATPDESNAFGDPLVCPRLHQVIAARSGNRVLETFLLALNSVWSPHVAAHGPLPFTQSGVQEVVRAHEAIVAAMRINDRALARIRMQRHLEALAPWFDARG